MKASAAILTVTLAILAGVGASPALADNYVTTAIRSTFKISNPGSTATCFVLAGPCNGDSQSPPLVLITAGHVLEKTQGEQCQLILRAPQPDGTFTRQEVEIRVRDAEEPLWVKHPDVDIAALRLDLPDHPSLIRPVPLTAVCKADTIAKGICHSGDDVRVLSYPAQVEANGAGFPIVRRGTIASFPLSPVPPHRNFLIDFNTFAGDSGGPVLLAPTTAEDQESTLILGLVIGQHMHEERFKLAYQESVFRHRLGIGIAVHGEFIHQTVALLPEL
jgi:hypothetical protein